MIYFFKEYIVEVKNIQKTSGTGDAMKTQEVSQLSIYDFKNQITMYWSPPVNGLILGVCIEETKG